jgi:hypothetical protein
MSARDHLADFSSRDFTPKLISAGQPYATRVTLYRPADPSRFTGTVFYEVLHPGEGGRALVWTRTYASLARRGDALVGIQPPLTVEGLRAVDPQRYRDLQAAHATQVWDALAQAALLGRRGEGLLQGHSVRRQILTGYSYTGVAAATFRNLHHDRAAERDGVAPFDGYVPMANAAFARPGSLPVIRLNTQSDFAGRGGLANRLPDADGHEGRHRLYEVAGASHTLAPPPGWGLSEPRTAVPEAQGLPNYSAADCYAGFPAGSHPNDYPLHWLMAGALANMVAWIDSGTPPPRAPQIETEADGSTRLDELGNAIGGVRLPHVSVPVAAYGVGSGSCLNFGYTLPFGRETLQQLHGDRATYLAKVGAEVARLQAERWIEPDAAAAILEATQAQPGLEA